MESYQIIKPKKKEIEENTRNKGQVQRREAVLNMADSN